MAELAFSCFPNRIISRNWTSNVCGIAPDSKFQAKPVTTIYIHSHGTNLRQKWVHLRTRRWQPWLRNPRPCPAVNGLVSGFEEKGQMKELPLVLNSNGQKFRYAWDGYNLHAISAEYAKDSRITMQDLLVNLLRNIRIAIRRAFVPENVRCNYMSYIRWKFLHRVLSSILHVQATQDILGSWTIQ